MIVPGECGDCGFPTFRGGGARPVLRAAVGEADGARREPDNDAGRAGSAARGVGTAEAGRSAGVVTDWRERAACRGKGPALFYPDEWHGTAAKAVCGRCPVRAECLDFALSVPVDQDRGVWGGLTEGERKQRRRQSAQDPSRARRCGWCVRPLPISRSSRVYCSDACRNLAFQSRRRVS